MDTAIINVKVPKDLKVEVQRVAKKLGLTVSALVNAYFRHVVRTKSVIFTLDNKIAARYLKDVLKEIER